MSKRVFNFSAGPATLPEPILKAAQEAIWDYGDSGIGVMEHSHRGPEITEVFDSAEKLLRNIAQIPDTHDILFLQGGASSQFFMIPMNFLSKAETADYLITGTWSVKAQKEANLFGNVHVAASSKENNFSNIPSSRNYSPSPKYVHYTSNNTIAGTQWERPPEKPPGTTLICDASSDILSRPIDVANHSLIYAGAQKNLGPAGLTLVIIRRNLIDSGKKEIPTMLQYRTHAEKGSRFNTPPVFAVYLLREMLLWLEQQGGLSKIESRNQRKAKVIYDALDSSSFFTPIVPAGSRSQMNICFKTPTEELDKLFVKKAAEKDLKGLKGHRSVGGVRASIYNSFPETGCEALVKFMSEFEKEHN